MTPSLSWTNHINIKLCKSLRFYFFLSRNIPAATPSYVKLNLYKTSILPILMYASCTWRPNKTSIRQLEMFNKRCLRWIAKDFTADYHTLLIRLNILPLCYLHHFYDITYLWYLYQSKTDLKLTDYIPLKVQTRSTRYSTVFQFFQRTTKKRSVPKITFTFVPPTWPTTSYVKRTMTLLTQIRLD